MKIAVEGCAHGELERIYETIKSIERAENLKIDLLLCCGDFQAARNLSDLQTMAVPPKFLDICSFYKYYSGELVAPILTIFVGGNHEASNYLQELPYGGWVAPNIYYLGYAGVVRVNGVRIAGISGIFKGHDYLRGHYEYCPYTEVTKRSVYHVRQLEVFRMKQLTGKFAFIMSHDWPQGIHNYGDAAQLLQFKPYFREDMEKEQLGSKPCMELLLHLKPRYWFSAHLHCKFAALVPHENENANNDNKTETKITKFLALDKCLPRRRFLQVFDIDTTDIEFDSQGDLKFEYDLEWLTVLCLTNHLLSVKPTNQYMPGPNSPNERYNFTPTNEEKNQVLNKIERNLSIPRNFCRTVNIHDPSNVPKHWKSLAQPKALINPQTTKFCDLLSIDDPLSLALLINGQPLQYSKDLNESINIKSIEQTDSLNISESSDEENSNNLDTSGEIEEEEVEVEEEITQNEDDTDDDNENENNEQIAIEDENDDDDDEVQSDNTLNKTKSYGVDETPIKKFKRRNQHIYGENTVQYG